MPKGVLVGLGNRDRGDDALGPLIVQQVARALDGHRIRVVERRDPLTLLDIWEGVDFAVVVDAVRSGRAPGSLIAVEAGASSESMTAEAWSQTGRGGTHALGLAACIELGRVLGKLPRRLLVLGVEAAQFDHGADLSEPVAAALGGAVEQITTAVLAELVLAQRPIR